jgi:hypothetical protein
MAARVRVYTNGTKSSVKLRGGSQTGIPLDRSDYGDYAVYLNIRKLDNSFSLR